MQEDRERFFIAMIKKALDLKKTSHFGTLDPMVTGVLPIALGRACKLMDYFIGKEKTYIGVMKVHSEISIEALQEQANNFLGKINQIPPVKSRVKRQERERTACLADIMGSVYKNDRCCDHGSWR